MTATVNNTSIVTNHQRIGEIDSIFQCIPNEILSAIFYFLKFQDILNISHVCFRWKVIALDSTSIKITKKYKNPELLLSIFPRLRRFCFSITVEDSSTLAKITNSLRDKCQTLTSLNLARCQHLTDVASKHLAYLSSLSSLDLGYCYRITDSAAPHLATLSSLSSLNLSGCSLTDAAAPHLATISSLTSLKLSRCFDISDSGVINLTSLSSLSFLDLGSCEITDYAIRYLEKLSSLVSLNLSYSLITDAAAQHLATFPSLTSLDLSECENITYIARTHLENLPSITYLNLYNGKISDEDIRDLFNL
jgi:Leucine-rich repeat (LRR) protein